MLAFLVKLLYLLIGFAAIGIIIIIHELGHFITAKLLKVEVETFSLGMGPKLFSIRGRKTEYRFSMIPFGGYCRMAGSVDLTKALKDEAKSFDVAEHGSYFSTTPFVRFLIFLAGPAINILLALLFFVIISAVPVETISNEAYVLKTESYPELYKEVIHQPGVEDGDLILSIENQECTSFEEAADILSSSSRKDVQAIINRGGKIIETTLSGTARDDGGFSYGLTLLQRPKVGRISGKTDFRSGDMIVNVNGRAVDNTNDFYVKAAQGGYAEVLRDGDVVRVNFEKTSTYPFSWENRIEIKRVSKGNPIAEGFVKTKEVIFNTIHSLTSLITGKSQDARSEITGPTRAASSIGTITVTGFQTSWRSGLRALLYLSSIVSLSIAIANLLPIPSFDGGQMLINLYQICFKKELTPKAYVVFQILGIIASAIILILMYSIDLIYYLK